MKYLLCLLLFFVLFNVDAQQTKYLKYLVDSIPASNSIPLKLPVDSGFMAVERLTISPDGKTIYYGVRNGYDSSSIAAIMKLTYADMQWKNAGVVFSDSSGAPILSKDGKTLYFQYDDAIAPKGMVSTKKDSKWTEPKRFLNDLPMSHYLQSPNTNNYYYAALTGKDAISRDIFKVKVSANDTVTTRLGLNLTGHGCCIDLYVAGDESYLIIAMFKKNNEDNYKFFGELDLFISFRNENEQWSKPINLGESVNGLSDWTWGPLVSNDDQYLFFSSWTANVGVRMIKFKPLLSKHKAMARW